MCGVVPKIFWPADGMLGVLSLGDGGKVLVHSWCTITCEMRSFDATESTLNHSKQMKRGEYEQGRKN